MSALTAAYVSKVLAAAGHPRSRRDTTRVRGWHRHSRGFTATGRGVPDGTVTVEWVLATDLSRSHEAAAAECSRGISAVRATLEAAGLTVEVVAPAGTAATSRALHVTRP